MIVDVIKEKKIKKRLKVFNYESCLKSESAMVFGGGPSACIGVDFIKKNNLTCLVFSANYCYSGLSVDYVYFGDNSRFVCEMKNINSKSIVVSSTIVDRFDREFWVNMEKRFDCYEVYMRGKPHCNTVKRWKIKNDGTFPYSKIGPSGFATILMSILCHPKNIFIFGIDGPIILDKKILYKNRFDGRKKKYGTIKKYRARKHRLEHDILPNILKREIKIYCPKESIFWGIDKSKYGIYNVEDY